MIRTAQAVDFRKLVELSKEYHAEHWFGEHTEFDPEFTHENFKAYSVGLQANVLVAEVDKELVGFSVAFLIPLNWCKALRCTIGYNYIRPDQRQTGLFAEMVQAHIDWATQHECVDVNMGDGAQYGNSWTGVTQQLGFTRHGIDSYRVLNIEKD